MQKTTTHRSTLALLGFATLFAAGCANAPQAPAMAAPALLNEALQLVVVTTPDWNATTGELRRFKRDGPETAWMPVGDAIPVVLGKAGLAWGAGYDSLATPVPTAGPLKQEGDMRSPAGLFTMSTAFGFAPRDSVPLMRLSYLKLKPGIECVDDTASKYYNNVIEKSAVEDADWQSSEKMAEIQQYKLGVIVEYNPTVVKGRGSCVFLHIWEGPSSTTSGCTAMDEVQLKEVSEWIQPGAHPMLAQMPIKVYEQLVDAWKLPGFVAEK